MQAAPSRPRRPARLDEPRNAQTQVDPFLMGLRVVLIGCAVALVGVLGHVAWKVISI